MAILEESVWITLNGRNIKYYEELNYMIPRSKDNRGRLKVVSGTKISVKIIHLPKMCNIKLTKICDICNKKTKKPQPYGAIVISRENGNGLDYCDECKGDKISKTKLNNLSPEDSLLFKFPLLSLEWNEKRNNISSTEVSAGSNKGFWWVCNKNKNHEWNASPNSRQTRGCPFCSGRKAWKENCLASVHPEVAKEWNYSKNGNLTPSDITYGSGKAVWWSSSICGHEWEAIVYTRTGKDKCGCSICKMSKGELKIYEILNKNHISFLPQYAFRGLLGVGGFPLKFDFAIFDSKMKLGCILEYDGEFHFEKRYDDHDYETVVIHDNLKNDYCRKNSIPLIRIPYWEYDNIETILNKELNITFQEAL